MVAPTNKPLSHAAPPEPGDYRELTSGILWIRLPVPGPLRHINVWLVPLQRGWFLVDTGLLTAAVESAWRRLDRRLPLRAELQQIVVTHHHPDHYGMAGWLSDRYGVAVHMTRQASLEALPVEPPRIDVLVDDFIEEFGLDLDDEMRSILRGDTYRSLISGHPAIEPLEAGQMLAGAYGPWRVSVHSGHAPGHACLHDEHNGILISGDQVLPAISSNISLYPGKNTGDPLGEYLESLHELSRRPSDTLVLPAHGRPFNALRERIDALQHEHAGRLQQIAQGCSEPASTGTLVRHIFAMDRLDAVNRLLATTETLAHLRRLETTSCVERRGRGAQMRWLARAGGKAGPEPVSFASDGAGRGVG